MINTSFISSSEIIKFLWWLSSVIMFPWLLNKNSSLPDPAETNLIKSNYTFLQNSTFSTILREPSQDYRMVSTLPWTILFWEKVYRWVIEKEIWCNKVGGELDESFDPVPIAGERELWWRMMIYFRSCHSQISRFTNYYLTFSDWEYYFRALK